MLANLVLERHERFTLLTFDPFLLVKISVIEVRLVRRGQFRIVGSDGLHELEELFLDGRVEQLSIAVLLAARA